MNQFTPATSGRAAAPANLHSAVQGAAGVVTAAGVAKNTLDDLLINNPRWRATMMKPSAGTASALLGALAGYFGTKLTGDLANDLADYVAGLFGGEPEQGAGAPR